jgi:tetratricopeptide (TPR) repeat protein
MPDFNRAILLHAAYYMSVLQEANRLYTQDAGGLNRALELFDSNWESLRLGLERTAQLAGSSEAAAKFCTTYCAGGSHLLELRCHPCEYIGWIESALAAARKTNDSEAEAVLLSNLGLSHADLGNYGRAIDYYEQALVIDRRLGNRKGEGATLNNLGSAYYFLGDIRRAINFYERRLVIAREIGDRLGEGNALFGESLALFESGDHSRAIHIAEAALTILEAIDGQSTEGVRKKLEEWREDLSPIPRES